MPDDETPTTEVIPAPSEEVITEDDLSEYEHLCSLLADIYERMERIETHLDAASHDNPPPAAETQIEEAKEEVAEEKTTIEGTSSDYTRTPKRVTFLW